MFDRSTAFLVLPMLVALVLGSCGTSATDVGGVFSSSVAISGRVIGPDGPVANVDVFHHVQFRCENFDPFVEGVLATTGEAGTFSGVIKIPLYAPDRYCVALRIRPEPEVGLEAAEVLLEDVPYVIGGTPVDTVLVEMELTGT